VIDYLLVKWLHVLSSTVLFGTGIGSAFYCFVASRGGEPRVAAWVTGRVVLADWLFTAPTVLLQPLTGIWLAQRLGLPLGSGWVGGSLLLYAVAVGCWLPVVWIQLRMRDIARAAVEAGAPVLPPAYRRLFHWWSGFGAVAFVAFIAIFWLMVAKSAWSVG
jgi:uncharacterized membrane protein